MISCKSKEEKMFFDFDSVEYYSLNKSKEEKVVENNRKGKKDSIFNNVFYNDYPNELNNEVFYKTINSGGYSKFELSQDDVEYLKNKVFIEKSSLKMLEMSKACAPEYRDILIFRKKNEISGIAKICLFCGDFYFVNSKKGINTEDFGTKKDFESLGKLFDKYKKDKI